MIAKTVQYNLSILFGTLVAAFAVGSIVHFTNPVQAKPLTFIFLYLGVFLCSLGVATLIGLNIRQKFSEELFIKSIWASSRQGTLIALLVVASLILQSQHLLFWWMEASTILFILFIEIFFNL